MDREIKGDTFIGGPMCSQHGQYEPCGLCQKNHDEMLEAARHLGDTRPLKVQLTQLEERNKELEGERDEARKQRDYLKNEGLKFEVLEDQEKTITQLEAELAEAQESLKEWEYSYGGTITTQLCKCGNRFSPQEGCLKCELVEVKGKLAKAVGGLEAIRDQSSSLHAISIAGAILAEFKEETDGD